MSYLIESDTFRGNLLALIGLKRSDSVSGLPEPIRVVEGGGWERFEWAETVRDSATGNVFQIYPTARLFEGVVKEVGIRSDGFFFVIEKGDAGWYFAGVPKEGGFGPEEVNWVRKNGSEFFNEGVE